VISRNAAPALLIVACWSALGPIGPLSGQQIALAPRALGTATSGAATASGVFALAASPARLAWGRPGFTEVVLPTGGFRLGLRPVGPRDLARYSGAVLPASVREAWLREIESEGAEQGASSVLLTPLAAARGRFAFQITTLIEVAATLNPDAAEALLFGNAGRTGVPTVLDFEGSTAEGWAVTSFALGAGWPLVGLSARTGGEWAIGGTARVSVGHYLWSALDAGSGTSTDPLALEGILPVVATTPGLARGSGIGVDLGAAWRNVDWTVDLVVRDVLNSFAWDGQDLEYRRGALGIGPDSTFNSSERLPLALAPVALRSRVAEFGFRRSATLSVGRRFDGRMRGAIEATCGPVALEARPGRLRGPLRAVDEDFGRCRLGASVERQLRRLTLRGGASASDLGTDVGVGVTWGGARGSLEFAYGRRLGSLEATGLALGATLRFGS